MEESTELSHLMKERKVMLSLITLYVDEGAILASGPTLEATAQIATMAFEETHDWLSLSGMKTDQVKNELMYFTKTRNQNANPSVHIPALNPVELKAVTPSKFISYLGLWFNPQLKFTFHEHH